jgi:hypothetical protein
VLTVEGLEAKVAHGTLEDDPLEEAFVAWSNHVKADGEAAGALAHDGHLASKTSVS